MKFSDYIIKANGEHVGFSEKKLRESLLKAGADTNRINEIISKVSSQLYPGISTKKIYKTAYAMLKSSERHLAARYHLKKALMELGPSGYSFEKYIGELMKIQGYQVRIGIIQEGICVQHEVDVIAESKDRRLMIECKYHNQQGVFCDVKIPLYIHSRFVDIELAILRKKNKTKQFEGWLITNTRFSKDALQYGNCIGLKLIGWDYPVHNGLKDLIDNFRLYPITCLTSLTKNEKMILLDKKIVLCNELKKDEELLETIGLKEPRLSHARREINQLCK